MESIFQVNPELNIPIYRQLIDAIRAAVKKGILRPGQQLPTVLELSADLGISIGTIKRAYDELDREGVVEKGQGRGTFVKAQSPLNRKDQAMKAIDELLDHLEEIGFSPAEISIYLNLKQRERAEQQHKVNVAVLECNPENLTHMADQLRQINGLEIHSHLMESFEAYPYKLGEDMDLVITTATHAQQVEKLLPVPKRVIRVGLRLTPACLAQIVKLRHNQVIGILCYSLRFGQLLHNTCATYTEGIMVGEPVPFAPDMDMEAFLAGKDAILLPRDFERYCTEQCAQVLRRFRGRLIECSYEMDEGSILYLEEKTHRILESKSI